MRFATRSELLRGVRDNRTNPQYQDGVYSCIAQTTTVRRKTNMNKALSVYLDFTRFLAAMLVFFFHASYTRFDGQWLSAVGVYGRDAVMAFFVLSGFVIAYVSNNRETHLRDYSISRLARLYSVVVPALLLTLLADYIGRRIDPSMYAGDYYQDSQPILRSIANLLFVNEIWFKSWRAFSNGPFWSMTFPL